MLRALSPFCLEKGAGKKTKLICEYLLPFHCLCHYCVLVIHMHMCILYICYSTYILYCMTVAATLFVEIFVHPESVFI